MTKHHLDAPTALTDGMWTPLRGVQVWVPAAGIRLDLGLLIACPTCHARVNRTCRTRTGHTTTPHLSRLVPRRCGCGAPLSSRRRLCDACRDRSLQDSKNAHGRRHQEVKNTWGRQARAKDSGRCWIPLGGDYRSLCGLPVTTCSEHVSERSGAVEAA